MSSETPNDAGMNAEIPAGTGVPSGAGLTVPPAIVGYCRACGKALDAASVRASHGTIYCQEHLPLADDSEVHAGPSSPYAKPYSGPYSGPYTGAAPPPLPHGDAAPGVAFMLGLIPGVGAIYNGQYAKGIAHVVILGLLISILNSNSAAGLEPLFGMLLTGFWFYMAFEAYHTARRRKMGVSVEEFSGFMPAHPRARRFPAGPVVLIALGLLFLLRNLGLLDFERWMRYWPVLLIVLGLYMLFNRVAAAREVTAAHKAAVPNGLDHD